MRFFVLLASAAAALAQMTINTPQGVLACTNYQVGWTGGSGPYILQVQPGGDTSAAALETFTGIAASPYQWHVIEPANTQVFLRLHDANGLVAESGTFTIQSAGATTCNSSSTPGGTTDVSGSSSGAAPPASTPVSTPAGSTPAPSGSSSGSSSATSHTSTTSTGGASAVQVAGGLVGLVGAVAVALA